MNFKQVLFVLVCFGLATVGFNGSVVAQQRERVVKTVSSQPTNLPTAAPAAEIKTKTTSSARPTLTNPIIVINPTPTDKPLVTKTASTRATNSSSAIAAGRTAYGSAISYRIYQGIMSKLGTPYRYGSTGPNTYDCSGFVWSVFNEAGVNFTRASARSLWNASEPVYGDDRFKFGTLVYLNGLGHMGIVADENGFYHASSSKGITYSPFAGYWSGRIVGYRKLMPEAAQMIKEEK